GRSIVRVLDRHERVPVQHAGSMGTHGGGRMLRRFLLATLVAIPCYLAGAFGGGALLYELSSNTHDRSMEAAMTGAFATGPAAAVIGFLTVMLWPKRNR
ncbi:MAG: hypothetical protein WC655_25640, partial [Candidatus Hydrogenedentales bacterium]